MLKPLFSIVIPTLNEEDSIPHLLQSLVEQTNKDFEVIVSDSGSTDYTKEKAINFNEKIPNFIFIRNKCKKL